MNYFSTTFLVTLLLLWLGGSHAVKQLQTEGEGPKRSRQTIERRLPRS